MISELTWYQFSNLPNINKLPQHEQERQYRIYLNEITMERFALIQEQMSKAEAMAAAAASSGGGGRIIQQEEQGGSGCIECVFNTSDGTFCELWIETSAPTNYTITWGDGETTTGATAVDGEGGVGSGDGSNKLEINHSYADSDTEYSASLCFDDVSLVTRLEFNGFD